MRLRSAPIAFQAVSSKNGGLNAMIEYCRDYLMRVRLVGTEVLKATLRQLFTNGKVELVGLFITLARQKGWGSPEEHYSTIEQFRK
jgi:hypothetical protein